MSEKRIYAIAMTVLWCVVFSSAFHSRMMGICMGILMGMSFGLFPKEDDQKEKKERSE